MSTPQDTPLTYIGYITQIATMAVVNTTTAAGVVVGVDAPFNNIVPQMLNYAELRIQRDLDVLPSLTSNTYSVLAGVNTLSIPINDFVTIQTLQAGGAPLVPVSKEWLQSVYGSSAATGTPAYFAMTGGDLATFGSTSNIVTFGPYTDTTYTITAYGTVRLPTLYQYATTAYAASSTTFISTYYPDLLIMASMIYISAFQRNFGKMSDDPEMPGSYEGQYRALLAGASVEEARKRFAASGWTAMAPTPAATPGR